MKEDNIVTEYINLNNEYKKKYGEKTFLLMEVGNHS